MAKKLCGEVLSFRGERVSLLAPFDLTQLLELKAQHPDALLIVGNTDIGTILLEEQLMCPPCI